MRKLAIALLAACGGGASVEGPRALIDSLDCSRLGPDNTGFMIEGEFTVGLEVGQAFTIDFEFPTTAQPVNRSDIYNCGSWSNTGFGGDSEGCQRDAGQNEASQTVFHSLAIEFPAPLPPPVSVNVAAKPLIAPGTSTTIGLTDDDSVDCM